MERKLGTIDENIQYWNNRADERERMGQTATAITFRNMAWLLENQCSWLEWSRREQDTAVKESLECAVLESWAKD